MKKIAVVLSGCGFQDGSEITEAISTLICLSRENVNTQCFAPDIPFTAVDHLTGAPQESRNVLSESARLCRGAIRNMKDLNANDFDALVLPGGYGVAKNLSNWAKLGIKAEVNPDLEKILKDFYQQQKPIGAICIAPAIVARVLGKHNIILTLGNDPELATEIEKTGAIHESCPVDEYISDRDNKILTTPAFMYETKPHLAYTGIAKLIRELVEMS